MMARVPCRLLFSVMITAMRGAMVSIWRSIQLSALLWLTHKTVLVHTYLSCIESQGLRTRLVYYRWNFTVQQETKWYTSLKSLRCKTEAADVKMLRQGFNLKTMAFHRDGHRPKGHLHNLIWGQSERPGWPRSHLLSLFYAEVDGILLKCSYLGLQWLYQPGCQ